ncbi:Lcl C-terminal domain-containing protein [Desulfonatronum thiodismutans]|uniref:Lcl C-terminal domain-containing protein n=1 Tax=Desulfonatronum thiodismutans TaxID=159290 RepID=UPI0009FD9DEE|nr:DUF1566 domain-containing protein [Desulfonatronum thiodismutans]
MPWIRAILFMAWIVLKEMQDHYGPTSTGEKIMKKLLAIAAMAALLCLSGQVMAETITDVCVDNRDGTITDKWKGLMWQIATAGPMNRNDAMSFASGLSLGGHSDWRLPATNELKKLYNSPCKRMMDVKPGDYWSSNGSSDQAWAVHFHDGVEGRYNANSDFHVRAVRSAQ